MSSLPLNETTKYEMYVHTVNTRVPYIQKRNPVWIDKEVSIDISMQKSKNIEMLE